MNESALELIDVSVRRGATNVVRGVSFALHEGESMAVLGRNGAGKTTLAHAIAGVLPFANGTLRLEGADVGSSKAHDRAARGIALVPEDRKLFSHMTVEENLILGGHQDKWWWGGPAKSVLEPVWEVFPALTRLRERKAGTLSGGEQQMVAIGRALVSRPKVLILDEPSSGLSPTAVEGLLERLAALRAGSLSILLFEQSVDVGFDLCDRIALLSLGELIVDGDAREVAASELFREALFGTTADDYMPSEGRTSVALEARS